jgi:epoxyqueuosine reductase
MSPEEWASLDERQFEERFGSTPLTRSGLERIRRNIRLTPDDAAQRRE